MRAQFVANNIANVGVTSAQILPARSGALKRTQLIITSTSTGSIITIAKGNSPAISLQGITLRGDILQGYIESTDSGFTCWQGAIQAIADVAGNLSIVETFEEK